jgi:carbonic anhydrase
LKTQVLRRLAEGNRRFAAGKSEMDISESKRTKAAYKQKPFAVVFGCSDSRVSPELIFDQGPGEIFVVRSAGLVLDRSVLGSMEFGVGNLQCPLLVLLGHSKCGGMKTAWESIRGGIPAADNFQYLVDALRPSLEQAGPAGPDIVDRAAKIHLQTLARQLEQSSIIRDAVRNGALEIQKAFYDLQTGGVEFTP